MINEVAIAVNDVDDAAAILVALDGDVVDKVLVVVVVVVSGHHHHGGR